MNSDLSSLGTGKHRDNTVWVLKELVGPFETTSKVKANVEVRTHTPPAGVLLHSHNRPIISINSTDFPFKSRMRKSSVRWELNFKMSH